MYIYTSLCQSDKPMPYVYMCIHKQTGHFYIGSRARKTLKYPSNVDLPLYKTSSKVVKPNFDNYAWVILAEFFDPNDAWDFEQQTIHEHWGNPLLINQTCMWQNKRRFTTIDRTYTHSASTKEKIAASKRGKKRSSEAIKAMSESRLGKKRGPLSDEVKTKMRHAAANRPPVTSETRAKLSAAAKKRCQNNPARASQTAEIMRLAKQLHNKPENQNV